MGPLWPSPSLAPQRQSERQRPLPSPARQARERNTRRGSQTQTETRAQDAGPAGPRWRRCVPAALSEGWWSGFLICGRVLRPCLGLGPVCGSEGLWARVSRRRCGYRQAVVRLWWGASCVVVLSVGGSVHLVGVFVVDGRVFVVDGRVLCGRCETRSGDGRAAA